MKHKRGLWSEGGSGGGGSGSGSGTVQSRARVVSLPILKLPAGLVLEVPLEGVVVDVKDGSSYTVALVDAGLSLPFLLTHTLAPKVASPYHKQARAFAMSHLRGPRS